VFDTELQFLETGWASVNKHDEKLCGDFFKIFESNGKKVFVLSDGLGSGVKANILSTLTTTILGTMLSRGVPIDECINTVATTLPICRTRKMAYSTFTVLQLEGNMAYLAQYCNPAVILLRQGKSLNYPQNIHFIGEKEIAESHIPLVTGDVLVLMSDGITNAGVGKLAPEGWKRGEVAAFLERLNTSEMSASHIAAQIVNGCLALSEESLDDDSTVLVIKLRERSVVNMLVGPPENKEDDNRVLKLFFAKEGLRVVCGGSTAHAVSKYQRKPLVSIADSQTDEIPAMSHIENVDYVTEGAITLQKLLQLCREYLEKPMTILHFCHKKDAASILARLLIETATDINIYFGMSANHAHEGTEFDFQAKLALIKELESCLEQMNKVVKISFC
jgi:serine/threonine protein phosphatase PrpC